MTAYANIPISPLCGLCHQPKHKVTYNGQARFSVVMRTVYLCLKCDGYEDRLPTTDRGRE